MDKLYRKITYPSGKVKYEESFEFDHGDVREGLWVHRKEGHGRSYSWISEYVEPVADLPDAIKQTYLVRAALETKRQDILNKVNGTPAMTQFDAIVSACFDVISGVK